MTDINPAIVAEFREKYRRGQPPSAILKSLLRSSPPWHPIELIRHVRSAFCLSLQDASPLAGWAADGTGELKDAQLDQFLTTPIDANRPIWDRGMRE